MRREYESARDRSQDPSSPQAATGQDQLRTEAVTTQRRVLETMRREGRITEDAYHCLEEELD